jgi:hypothetical protein
MVAATFSIVTTESFVDWDILARTLADFIFFDNTFDEMFVPEITWTASVNTKSELDRVIKMMQRHLTDHQSLADDFIQLKQHFGKCQLRVRSATNVSQ